MKNFEYCLFSKECNPIACEGDDINDSELVVIEAIDENEAFNKMCCLFPERQFILWQ